MLEDTILTKKRFAQMIEEYVHSKRVSYMDAIIEICENRELDPGDIGSLISPAIKDKIEAEAIESRMIKGGNQLPL